MKKYYEVTRGNNTFIYTGETNKDVFKKDTLQVFDNLKDALIDIIVRYPKHRIINVISESGKERIDLKDPSFKYQDIYSRAVMLRTKGTGITNRYEHGKFRHRATMARRKYQHKNDEDFIRKGKTIMYPYEETRKEPIPNFKAKKLTFSEYKKDQKGIRIRHDYGYLGYDDVTVDELNRTKCDSVLELKVYQYLKNRHIKFNNQEDCKLICINPKTGKRLLYDFEIPSIKLVIEVQGSQHYEKSKDFNKTDNDIEEQFYRDHYKQKFATKNGYKELKIRYTSFKDNSFENIIKHSISSRNQKLAKIRRDSKKLKRKATNRKHKNHR